MLSRRLPRDTRPNPIADALARRPPGAGALLDLTETNPTRVGLSDKGDAGAALAEAAGVPYEPRAAGAAAAREAVAASYVERGLRAEARDVVLTASTSEAYAHLLRLLCEPGDAVAVPHPGYPLLEPLAALEGVELRPYRLDFDGAWHLDADSLARALDTRTRAVVVVQPNNPTGSCLSPIEIGQAESLCARHGAALIADEVFGEFPRPGAPAMASLLGPRAVPTFVLGGISKSCGLPQMKVGWVVAAGPAAARAEALSGLEWIADLFLSVSSPAQSALPRWLAARSAFQGRVGARIERNLAAVETLARSAPEVTAPPAHGGWMQVLRVPRTRGDEAWALDLLRRGVLVHPGYFYDFADDGYLVVSLLPEPAAFAEAMTRVAECVRTAAAG